VASNSTLGRIRFALWGIVGIAAIVAGALVLGHLQEQARLGKDLPGASDIGGDFTLVDTDGQAYSSAALKGKPYAIFFGFTHCPDICPTTLLEASKHLEALGPAADRLEFLFVTVDPTRDTPELMKTYLSAFDERIIGLTGSEEQIADISKKFRIVSEKVPTSGGDYTMNHTATVFLFDENGMLAGTLGWYEDAATRQEKLERLVKPG